MSSVSRSFIKLVQHDLLALSDGNLIHLVHQWIETVARDTTFPTDALNNARLVLGYTHTEAASVHEIAEYALDRPVDWHPPAPSSLRLLLTEMDVRQFKDLIIPVAFQSLHTTHPEWGEDTTFCAHLANYLRQKQVEQDTVK